MIPFEELSEALARWRARNGIQSQRSTPHVEPPAFVPSSTDEMMAAEPTAVTANPLAEVSPARESSSEFDLDSLFVDDDRT